MNCLAISPHRKVPVLRVDDSVSLFESSAINEYLDPLGRSLPPDDSGPRATRKGEGRPIGENFTATDLFGVIQRVPFVKTVVSLAVRVNGQPHQPLAKPIIVPADAMVYGTPDHEISVVPYSESDEEP